MAIGFGKKKPAAAAGSDIPVQQDPGFGEKAYYDGFSPTDDVERAGGAPGPRRKSRIDRPITKSISGSVDGRGIADDTESDPSVAVGKQMELEAGNEIQYRTCSWHKV